MNITVLLALAGIVPLALFLGGLLTARRMILTVALFGMLFLPNSKLSVIGIPDYDKIVATNLAVFLACLIYHRRQLLSIRVAWFDMVVVLACIAPGLSSITNDLGAYDALSNSIRSVLVWALPYWVGRVFFNSAEAMRDLALAIIIGALVYVPFCLFEIRMSPQLHFRFYGTHVNQYWRNLRFGGYRPVVFMQSGLMVGVWMSSATILAYWLWSTGRKKLVIVPMWLVCGALFATTVLCKALYAIVLMFAAIALLSMVRYAKTILPLVLLLVAVPAYMITRSTGLVTTADIADAALVFGEDRAQSLEARLLQEDVLIDHISDRPNFGWGGWMRSWPIDPYTGKYELRGIDAFWTSVLGQNGLFGVLAFFSVLLLPVAMVLWRLDAVTLGRDEYAAAAALAVALLLFACDCLLNGMINPIYTIIGGGLAALPAASATQALADPMVSAASVAPRRRLRHWHPNPGSEPPTGGIHA